MFSFETYRLSFMLLMFGLLSCWKVNFSPTLRPIADSNKFCSKIAAVFHSIQRLISSNYIPYPCWRKATPEHDAATTIFDSECLWRCTVLLLLQNLYIAHSTRAPSSTCLLWLPGDCQWDFFFVYKLYLFLPLAQLLIILTCISPCLT